MPHAKNVADAPLSVQENIWPFIESGHVEWFNGGDETYVRTLLTCLRPVPDICGFLCLYPAPFVGLKHISSFLPTFMSFFQIATAGLVLRGSLLRIAAAIPRAAQQVATAARAAAEVVRDDSSPESCIGELPGLDQGEHIFSKHLSRLSA